MPLRLYATDIRTTNITPRTCPRLKQSCHLSRTKVTKARACHCNFHNSHWHRSSEIWSLIGVKNSIITFNEVCKFTVNMFDCSIFVYHIRKYCLQNRTILSEPWISTLSYFCGISKNLLRLPSFIQWCLCCYKQTVVNWFVYINMDFFRFWWLQQLASIRYHYCG